MSRSAPAIVTVLTMVLAVAAGHAAPGGSRRAVVTGGGMTGGTPPGMPLPTSGTSPILAMAALDRRIADLEAEEGSLKKELDGLGGSLAGAHGQVVTHGRSFYRLVRAGLLPVGGGFDQLVSHAMKVERARRALAADLQREQQLRAHGADIARDLERIAKDRSALSSQRAQAEAARAQVEEESRRQAAFDRAFTTSTGASDYVAIYGGSGASGDFGTTGFASSRGRLLFPLAGRSEVKAARREGTDGPGLEIRAPLGTAVRAVYAGRVAFADRYGAYGRIVILDHGDHYYTVSGNLAAADVKVGDEVSAGERIGAVGNEGGGAMLYFEVRHGTDTVPPGPWLGL